MKFLTSLGHLDNKFQSLDQLPDELYRTIVTHPHGELDARTDGIMQWRAAFLNGKLPDEKSLKWPDKTIRRTILKRVEILDIVRYCEHQIELTDAILNDVCDAIISAEAHQEIDPGFDDKLARQHKKRDSDTPFDDPDWTSEHPDKSHESTSSETLSSPNENSQSTQDLLPVDDSEQASTLQAPLLNAPTIGEKGGSTKPADSALENEWAELAKQWQQLEDNFSELSGFLGRGWDLTQGLLASQGWRDIIRYRKLVKSLPWLEDVIASLGRLKERSVELSNNTLQESSLEQISAPIKRVVETEIKKQSPHIVHETSGIRRSDDITRILPAELAQLGHPQLNLLWHAKRAEHTLMTYQVDGVYSEHEPQEELQFDEQCASEQETETNKDSELAYGPIIVCLDSSTSMQGEPENIAKAIVLEALRIAWKEQRACYVYLFSGAGQMLTHNLDLTRGGLAELLDFLTQTFQGGTDVVSPLLQAMAKQAEANWQASDILLVTDGRFPLTDEQKRQINHARKISEQRIHGVLIGNWKADSLQSLCDYFHRVSV